MEKGEIVKLQIIKTKKGFPAMWESGGSYTNTGSARLVADKDGKAKIPIYFKTRGHLSCGEHALFILNKNDLIIDVDRWRNDYEIKILRFLGIDKEHELYGKFEVINSFDMGEWDEELSSFLEEVVKQAKRKSNMYHNRYAIFYKQQQKN